MTDDEIYAAIHPVWRSALPGYEAQSIRAGISLPASLEDELPDYVWLIADIAAQRAFARAISLLQAITDHLSTSSAKHLTEFLSSTGRTT